MCANFQGKALFQARDRQIEINEQYTILILFQLFDVGVLKKRCTLKIFACFVFGVQL